MDDLIRLVARAKAAMDNGFSRIGPNLKSDHAADGALMGGAGRVVALSDALVLLCKQDHAAEAALFLRPLTAIALAMRAVAAAGEAGGGSALDEELWDLDWKRVWSDPEWKKYLASAGIAEQELSTLHAALTRHDYFNLYAGTFSIPWGHVYQKRQRPPASAQETLQLTVRCMAHALRALEARWPGAFLGSEDSGPAAK